VNEGWTVSHLLNKLSRLHKPTLYNLLKEPSAKAYWVDHRKQLTTPAFDDADWTITGDAVCSLRISRHHWLTKHVTGIRGIGKIKKSMANKHTPIAPNAVLTKTLLP
jgi:hypothetical protein